MKRVFDENRNQRCNKCFEFKPLTEFRIKSSSIRCKKCEHKYYDFFRNTPKYKKKATEWKIKNPKYMSDVNKSCRYIALMYYSDTFIPSCVCCKTTFYDHLTIDHIIPNSNPTIDRRNLARSLVKSKFPEGFQILCQNCNRSKGVKDKCFHNTSLLPKKETRHTKYYSKIIKIIFNKYTDQFIPCCKCCNETGLEFLELDHIDNNGSNHRKKLKLSSGLNTYLWIIRNNFPPIFQLLCTNCNFTKGMYGKCNCQSILPIGCPNLLEICPKLTSFPITNPLISSARCA